jgi:hypothetical protein
MEEERSTEQAKILFQPLLLPGCIQTHNTAGLDYWYRPQQDVFASPSHPQPSSSFFSTLLLHDLPKNKYFIELLTYLQSPS